jgi:hypothetical protein
MSDQIKRDQEVIALRQRVTEMYANDPAKLNALPPIQTFSTPQSGISRRDHPLMT